MSADSSQASAAPQDRYRVLFPLGRGGMGSVEVALEEHGAFRRLVALKTMLTESARNARDKEMFLREARLARMLNHPNVVHAFGAGAEGERLYIAMEYVEGTSLNALLARARDLDAALSPALTAYILAELCDGLHAAHELRDDEGKLLGVVHRDVSPHNVMVSYSGHVKVLDFGVARIDESKLTHTGEVKGKTSYMAPEQALGEELDRRSDLFAVGAILYECLAGVRMWGTGSDVEVMRRLALEEPPRLAETTRSAPAELAELQARLVTRDPGQRPGTAAEVGAALRRYLATCSPGADETTLRALMLRLFATEASERRLQLARALEGVVDRAGADALKQSLSAGNAPLTDSERRLLVQLRPPRAAFEAVSAADLPALPVRARPSAGLLALGGLVLAGGALFFVKMTGTSAASDEPRSAVNAASVVPSPAAPSPSSSSPTASAAGASPSAGAEPAKAPSSSAPDGGLAARPAVPNAAPPRASRVRPAAPNGPSAPATPSPPRPEIDTRAF